MKFARVKKPGFLWLSLGTLPSQFAEFRSARVKCSVGLLRDSLRPAGCKIDDNSHLAAVLTRVEKPGFSTKDSGFHASIFARNPVSGLVQDLR